ncbi:flagellar biosynthetic protein FliO [Fodinibius salsisoli]|uniref:Flagellar biosynthetic protein FliO n=1 Tax=Fodinibius salsisoli TaxID=2820877 RepID=A0ABT3PHH2_9BACT|nr:flagellar biosynthetic protein FliO [Fodinibius salsisoli]MCW9705366.1 flagellar biosynthetic protein FliO [Fodinibius salsisoli]
MDLRDKLSSLDAPPSKILKIVLGLAVVLLLMWLFTLSHIDYSQGSSAKEYIKAETDSTEQVISSSSNVEDKADDIQSYKQPSGVFTNGLITFLVLLVVLVMVWFWVDRKQSGRSGRRGRELDSHVLGEGAKLKIVEINQEVWVVGVTSSTVNLLHRYPREEWKEKSQEQDSKKKDVFRKLLKRQMS